MSTGTASRPPDPHSCACGRPAGCAALQPRRRPESRARWQLATPPRGMTTGTGVSRNGRCPRDGRPRGWRKVRCEGSWAGLAAPHKRHQG
eukprot:12484109-Alexandrium_andersonii.AAC.1